jgi:uncharacterized DUF497 family protein
MKRRFEWDPEKARANRRTHGVSFEEAASMFGDWFHITRFDPLHSTDEERFVTIGMSTRNRLLVVIHTDREDRVRIISARLANRLEKENYEEN